MTVTVTLKLGSKGQRKGNIILQNDPLIFWAKSIRSLPLLLVTEVRPINDLFRRHDFIRPVVTFMVVQVFFF